MNDLKNIESIFDGKVGYDTRKTNNRNSSVFISEDLISKIESEGITSEELNSIGTTIFKYQNQITVHGNFGTSKTIRIGGYQNIIVNGNGSMGVKYNAIDAAKKNDIYSAIKICYPNFTTIKNSTEWCAFSATILHSLDDMKNIIDKYVAIKDRIQKDLCVGTYSIYTGQNFLGVFVCMAISIDCILQENVIPFIESLCGKSYGEITEIREELKLKREEEQRLLTENFDAERKAQKDRNNRILKVIIDNKCNEKKAEDGVRGFTLMYGSIVFCEIRKTARQKIHRVAYIKVNEGFDFEKTISHKFSNYDFQQKNMDKFKILSK